MFPFLHLPVLLDLVLVIWFSSSLPSTWNGKLFSFGFLSPESIDFVVLEIYADFSLLMETFLWKLLDIYDYKIFIISTWNRPVCGASKGFPTLFVLSQIYSQLCNSVGIYELGIEYRCLLENLSMWNLCISSAKVLMWEFVNSRSSFLEGSINNRWSWAWHPVSAVNGD